MPCAGCGLCRFSPTVNAITGYRTDWLVRLRVFDYTTPITCERSTVVFRSHVRLAGYRVFSQATETHFSYAPVSRSTSHQQDRSSGTAASRSARKRKVEKGVCLMCLGGPNPSYLLHPPALRSKRCADDLWRQDLVVILTLPAHPRERPQTLRTHFICFCFGRTGDDLVLT